MSAARESGRIGQLACWLVSTGGKDSASRLRYLRETKSGIPAIAIKAMKLKKNPRLIQTISLCPFSLAILEQNMATKNPTAAKGMNNSTGIGIV